MRYIEPHAHMASRTTDDYEQLALTGCLAISDPAFWAGYDRGSAAAFAAYFEQLTAFEPLRAAPYGLRHYSWLSLNPKEAEDRELARKVLESDPDLSRAAERAGNWRDRAEPGHSQRVRHAGRSY